MTSFKLFAGTDVGLRDNNEDNFTVNPDLTLDKWIVPANQQETIPLGKRGCLMVVADGMGGMNAGEVASDVAIKTVQDMFSPSKFPDRVIQKQDSIKNFLEKVIIQADCQVKQRCKDDPSTEGMGSTIVIAWLINGYIYIGWMGDSRAYSYIPGKGISRLSKDHSFVQQLVDEKMLTEEEAMLHPQSNIITRSLGDMTQKAKPEVVRHPAKKGEIILLCSDGLCGVCKDDVIADITNKMSDDLKNCKEALTNAALEAEGSDNITIALLQIVEVDEKTSEVSNSKQEGTIFQWRNLLFGAFALFILFSLFFAGLKTCDSHSPSSIVSADSTQIGKDTILDDTTVKKKTIASEGKDSNTISSKTKAKTNDKNKNNPLSNFKKDNAISDNNTTDASIEPTPSKQLGDATINPSENKPLDKE